MVKLTIEQARQSVQATLGAIPGLTLLSCEQIEGPDGRLHGARLDHLFRITWTRGGEPARHRWLLKLFASGQPRWARAACNLLLAQRAHQDDVGLVFVAPYISPASALICQAAGVGYLDLSGNCRLAERGLYVEIAGRPNRFRREGKPTALFAPKAEALLRVLLCDPARPWTTLDLAGEADVSAGQAANVRAALLDREWARGAAPAGITLTAPGDCLDAWRAAYRPQRHRVLCRAQLPRTVPDLESGLAEYCRGAGLTYGLSGLAGAARYAPKVTYGHVLAYVDMPPGQQCDWADALSGPCSRADAERTRLTLLGPYHGGVFHRSLIRDRQAVVSPVQCYLDLKEEGGRADEAAKALRKEVLEPAFDQAETGR